MKYAIALQHMYTACNGSSSFFSKCVRVHATLVAKNIACDSRFGTVLRFMSSPFVFVLSASLQSVLINFTENCGPLVSDDKS